MMHSEKSESKSLGVVGELVVLENAWRRYGEAVQVHLGPTAMHTREVELDMQSVGQRLPRFTAAAQRIAGLCKVFIADFPVDRSVQNWTICAWLLLLKQEFPRLETLFHRLHQPML
jgi:hypothetical protein